jgi:hypothetical protein
MTEPCYVRRVLYWSGEYVQTSDWFIPGWVNPETGLTEPHVESHPEWDTEPLKASIFYADVIERRPWSP